MIRPSEESDLAAISKIFLIAFSQSVDHYVGGHSSGVRRAVIDIFTAIREYEPDCMLVADADGNIAGYIIAIPRMKELWWHVIKGGYWWDWAKHWLQGDYGFGLREILGLARNKLGFASAQVRLHRKLPRFRGQPAQILSIAVHPIYRGQGIGGALLQAALAYLATTPATYVKLEVRPDNPSARQLYESAGFRYISTTYDAQGPWHVMLKDLNKNPARK